MTSAGVGASAAIPVVGTGIALTLGVTDLLFFYEISALYVLAATELHGIEVHDAERARPLVFGMLLGEKSQSKVAKAVLQAAGAGSVTRARKAADVVAGKALPKGWGEVLTQQLPDSALAPVATVIAKQALKQSAKFGAGTLGKVIPFGIGAVVGGVGSFSFGRSVVKSARLAFPVAPTAFPEALQDFSKPDLSVVVAVARREGDAGGGVHCGGLWRGRLGQGDRRRGAVPRGRGGRRRRAHRGAGSHRGEDRGGGGEAGRICGEGGCGWGCRCGRGACEARARREGCEEGEGRVSGLTTPARSPGPQGESRLGVVPRDRKPLDSPLFRR